MSLPTFLADAVASPAGQLTQKAAEKINQAFEGIDWIPNPFVTIIVLVLATLAGVVWLGLRQKQIAENQRRLGRLIDEVADRVDEALEETDRP
jgi:hypothetical protein